MTIMMAQQWQWLWQQCSAACSTGKNTAALAKSTLIQVLLPACSCGTVSDGDNGTLQVHMMQVEEGSMPQMAIHALPTFVIDRFLKIQVFKVFLLCRVKRKL